MARPRTKRSRCSTVLHCDGEIMRRVDAVIRSLRRRELRTLTFAEVARRAFVAGLAVLEEDVEQAASAGSS